MDAGKLIQDILQAGERAKSDCALLYGKALYSYYSKSYG